MPVDDSDIDQCVTGLESYIQKQTALEQQVGALAQQQAQYETPVSTQALFGAVWLLADIAKSARRIAAAEEAMVAAMPSPAPPAQPMTTAPAPPPPTS